VRNVQEHKNPYPPGYGFRAMDSFSPFTKKEHTKNEQALVNMFSQKSSIKQSEKRGS